MRVLLISANTERINMPVLPLGLALIAEATRLAGHEVRLLNLMAHEDTSIAIKESIEEFSPQLIGISVRNIDDQNMERPRFLLDPVKEVVEKCRTISSAPIVIGGAGYSIFPKSALSYLKADIGIQGEGEWAFVELIKRMERGEEISGIPGIYLPDTPFEAMTRSPINLDEYPLPNPDFQSWSHAIQDEKGIMIPFQTRRGCPMNCNYCSTPVIEGNRIRRRSIEQVIKSIYKYVEAGHDRFFFVDNTFNLPPTYAEALCDSIIKEGLKISWRSIVYPWKIKEDLVKKMAMAGCKEVSLGFESGSKRVLRSMGKMFSPEDVRYISGIFKKYGIKQTGFLLLGGPSENRDSVEESLYFADSLKLDAMKITIGIRIYPDTSVARIAIKEGLIESQDELLFPRFYMARGLEDWLRKTIRSWLEGHPGWML
jgi:radical SAM superfamily enzyme YgiQ (UPF0313 family)